MFALSRVNVLGFFSFFVFLFFFPFFFFFLFCARDVIELLQFPSWKSLENMLS